MRFSHAFLILHYSYSVELFRILSALFFSENFRCSSINFCSAYEVDFVAELDYNNSTIRFMYKLLPST